MKKIIHTEEMAIAWMIYIPVFLSLCGCILDLTIPSLSDYSVQDTIDPPFEEDNSGDFFDSHDMENEEIDCGDGWFSLSNGQISWCVSSFIGMGNCCEAAQICTNMGGMPGFWPTAGPYDGVVPYDFSFIESKPLITIVFCSISTQPYSMNCIFNCMDENGDKIEGYGAEEFDIRNCDQETCQDASGSFCTGQEYGCGALCRYHYWCWKNP